MTRPRFPRHLAAVALASVSLCAAGALWAAGESSPAPAAAARLTPPPQGKIRVAFLISEGANVIDLAGPWEVFQDTMVHERTGMDDMAVFELMTVAVSKAPVRATGGLQLVPDYALADAPQPHVIVVPAMRGAPEVHAWLREKSVQADITLSVCTGAYQLARAGLLDGLAATTHHDYWDDFAGAFPKVRLERGPRFVDNGRIATAGGLTSGVDLALRVVERYFGRAVAQQTATYMEHKSEAWKVG